MMRIHKGRTNNKKQNDTILKTKTNVTNYFERNKIMLTAAPRPATIAKHLNKLYQIMNGF